MMKRLFFLAFIGIGFFFSTMGISGGQTTPSKPSGELRIVFPSLWNEALDPIFSSASGRIGLLAIYDDLVGAKADGSALSRESGLARDWQLSSDGKTWTFYLRQGAQFHRGYGELTAQDVVFSLKRTVGEKSVSQQRSYFRKNLGEIEIVDKYTVKIRAVKDPIPDMIYYLSPLQSSTEPFIVSKRAVEELGEAKFAIQPVGTGPYQFIQHIGGQSIKLEAVEKHWRLGNPRFKNVYFLAVPEEETSIAMLARGEADVVPIMRANIKRVKEKGFPVILREGSTVLNVWFDDQFAPGVPVNHPKVREALNLAIDRKAIVETIFEGRGKPSGNYYAHRVVLEKMGYKWQEDFYPYDPQRARQLLAEAGYRDGFNIDVYIYPWTGIPEMPNVIEAVAGMWGAIGVRPKLIQVDYGVVRAKLLKGEIPGAAGYFPADPRPWQGILGMYRTFMHSTGAFGHVKQPELDQLLDAASTALDPEVSQTFLKKAIKFIRQNHLAAPICEIDSAYAVSKKATHWDPGFLAQNMNFDSLFKK